MTIDTLHGQKQQTKIGTRVDSFLWQPAFAQYGSLVVSLTCTASFHSGFSARYSNSCRNRAAWNFNTTVKNINQIGYCYSN